MRAKRTFDRRQRRRSAEALLQDAAALPEGPERDLKLAEGYRDLADTKRMVLRQVNLE